MSAETKPVQLTCLVVGGSGALGVGIVRALVEAKARVVALAQRSSELARMRSELSIETLVGDGRDPILAARTLPEVRPNVLIVAAGARGANRPTVLQDWRGFSRQIDTDLRIAFTWTRAALRLPLVPSSSIVLTSSAAALRPMPVNAGYAAGKSAIWAFAQAVAPEAAALGIRVHCLLPILAPETPMGSAALDDFVRFTGVSREEIITQKGMRPFLTPAIVGNAVVTILAATGPSNPVGWRITGSGPQPL